MTSSLTIERELAAEPLEVWRALTDPRRLAWWFWPPRFEPAVETDARLGGSYRIASETVGIAVAGRYEAVDPPSRLAFTWRWDGEDEETLVTVLLVGSAEGTSVIVSHEGFADPTTRDEHAQGWQDCLERLPAALIAFRELG